MTKFEGISRTVGASPVSIGRFTYGYGKLKIKEWGEGSALRIGSFCSLAEDITVILGGNHRTDWITTFPFGHIWVEELGGSGIVGHPVSRGDVVVGNDVWIAHGATLMSGVTIGDGAVIGGNATVTRDVAPYEIVGGNPIAHIRFRFPPEIVEKLLELKWWELPIESIREIVIALSAPPTLERVNELIARYRTSF